MSGPSESGRVLPFASKAGLTFGIYHGGVVDMPDRLATGKPDEPERVNRALDTLQGGKQLLVRTYLRFSGKEPAEEFRHLPKPEDLAHYALNGRKLDLVLSNWDCTGDMEHWTQFIERAIECLGEHTKCLQICEEPNLYDYPGDGRFEHRVEAVMTGVKCARAKLRERGLSVAVGFNSIPSYILADHFWRELAVKMDDDFLNTIDYVGLNFYPDVAEPVRGTIADAVYQALRHFRETTLEEAGIPGSIPIRICENGWPTGPQRFYTHQAEVLEQVIHKVYDLRGRLNINGFGLFCLRDANTGNPDTSGQFGILRDDYTPKPAFETVRQLIQELGE